MLSASLELVDQSVSKSAIFAACTERCKSVRGENYLNGGRDFGGGGEVRLVVVAVWFLKSRFEDAGVVQPRVNSKKDS